jgi:hypothetical protein
VPPAGETPLSVTTQTLAPAPDRLVGLQLTLVSESGANKDREDVFDTPLEVAVIVTVVSDVTAAALALNVAVACPAGTVTVPGTVTEALLADSVTAVPPAGAAVLSVIAQTLAPAPVRLAGLQLMLVSETGVKRDRDVVLDTPPEVAVIVTVVAEVTAEALALNVAVVCPASTVTVPGTVTEALLADSVTAVPPVGAAAFSVTVQTLVPAPFRLAGLQLMLVSEIEANRDRDVVLDTPPKDAVTVTVVAEVTAEALALNVAVVCPAGTVTVAGTVTEALLADSVTAVPPVGAALPSATVQTLAPAPVRLAGLQLTLDSEGGETKDKVVVFDTPLAVAVIVTAVSDGTATALALNVAAVWPAGTVTVPGTVTKLPLLDSATAVPPAGAAPLSVTVQTLEPAPAKLAGLQLTPASESAVSRERDAVCEAPLKVAVIVAVALDVTAVALALNVAVV